MFRNATGFSLIAGEVTNVEGTLRRQNSPTRPTSTFGTGNPYGHPPQAPVQPATHHQSGRGIGMFANASNFMMTTGSMTNTEGDYEQINSGTRTTINMGEAAAAHAQRMSLDSDTYGVHLKTYRLCSALRTTGAGLYNDSRSSAVITDSLKVPIMASLSIRVSYSAGYGSPQMVYGNRSSSLSYQCAGKQRRTSNGSAGPSSPPPSFRRRLAEAFRFAICDERGTVDNRGSRRPARAQTVYPQTQAVQPQTTGMQPRESKHRKKTKGKDGRTKKHRHEAEEDVYVVDMRLVP
ncbi:hypothetical protein B0H13DRAFT_1881350 [Mycena leptocephala]|nr:hypothetical protein B0H13DRAFT_1881350 [Mycena leptocephala]